MSDIMTPAKAAHELQRAYDEATGGDWRYSYAKVTSHTQHEGPCRHGGGDDDCGDEHHETPVCFFTRDQNSRQADSRFMAIAHAVAPMAVDALRRMVDAENMERSVGTDLLTPAAVEAIRVDHAKDLLMDCWRLLALADHLAKGLGLRGLAEADLCTEEERRHLWRWEHAEARRCGREEGSREPFTWEWLTTSEVRKPGLYWVARRWRGEPSWEVHDMTRLRYICGELRMGPEGGADSVFIPITARGEPPGVEYLWRRIIIPRAPSDVWHGAISAGAPVLCGLEDAGNIMDVSVSLSHKSELTCGECLRALEELGQPTR